MRSGVIKRSTTESDVHVELSLDIFDKPSVQTGIRMFDHLLAQFGFHAGCDLDVRATSLDNLRHHVVEDTAIALGRALDAALGERAGIVRYGEATIPMDEALVLVVVDFGGRPFTRVALPISCDYIEDLATPMIAHVLTSFAQNARIAIHVDLLAGSDPHHIVEATFKALARACVSAWVINGITTTLVPSTKGLL